MTRPILWAATAFGVIAIAASAAGERMSRLVRAPEPADRPIATSRSASAGRPAPAERVPSGVVVTVPGDGHGHFKVETSVDGFRLAMLVDTGASMVALSHEDALAAGIRPAPSDYTRSVATANGSVPVAPVRIREIRVGSITVRDVEAVVVPPGRLGTSLLGMTFLRQLRGFDIANDRLTLRG